MLPLYPGAVRALSSRLRADHQRLLERLQAWKREVGAQEPTPNENFDIESAWDGPAKKGKKHVLAVGDEAKLMLGRTPGLSDRP